MYKRITLFILCLLLLPSISFAKFSQGVDKASGLTKILSNAWIEDEAPYNLKCFQQIMFLWVGPKDATCSVAFAYLNQAEYGQFATKNAILKLNNDEKQIYNLPYLDRMADKLPYQGKKIDASFLVYYVIPGNAVEKIAVADSATITIKTESKKEITYEVDPKLLVEWKQVLNARKIE